MGCVEGGSCGLVEDFTWITFVIILMSIVFLTFISCVCIKIRDMQLQAYLRKHAMRKGVNLDLDEIVSKPIKKTSDSSQLNENCTILIPDIAIVL